MARDGEFEEFGPSLAAQHQVRALGYERLDPGMFDAVSVTARAQQTNAFARGLPRIDPGTYDAPVSARLPNSDDAALVRTLDISSAGLAGGANLKLECWFTAY